MTHIQAAFASPSKLLKGALHVHTTRSDGSGAPEEVLRLYADKGFDFVALTDHNVYNTMNFAPETGLLIIPATERDHTFYDSQPGMVHTFHTVCLGRSKERGNKYEHDQRFERRRVADQAELQPILDEIHQAGQSTFLCHPQWSGTPAREFDQLNGHFAMEIWNSGCVVDNDQDANAAYWDEILQSGKRWHRVAVDDGHPMSQHGHGWVMVNADKTINSVIDALEAGAFYSSCGPEIHSFRVEDNGTGKRAVIECTPCVYAGFASLRRPTHLATDYESATVTRAEFDLPEGIPYVRGVVKDSQGRRAWTNPIWL